MNLVALPALADNDIWMLHDGARAVGVDPADAAPVHSAQGRLPLDLGAILVSPHRAGHVGTVDTLEPARGAPWLAAMRERKSRV